ncbi:hypothetical protein D3C78_1636650 [compost metagenome]
MSIYRFQNNRLFDGGYFVALSSANSHVKDYKALVAYLTKQYGEPTLDAMKVYQDEEGNPYSDEQWNQAIMSGKEGLIATWRTVDTEIQLVVVLNLHEMSDIQISYTSWLSPNYGKLSK